MKARDITAKNAEQVAKERGFTLVRSKKDQRSSNKFLGSENPRSTINPNGYDPVQRAKDIAQRQVQESLAQVMARRVQSETD